MTASDDGPGAADRAGDPVGLVTRRLHGRRAVVSGGAHGIGKAIAERLASEGAAVAIFDVDDASASEVCESISAEGGTAVPLHVDVTEPDQIREGATAAEAALGGIADIVVCNAGYQTFNDLWSLSLSEWDDVFRVNVRGAFSLLRTLGGAMREDGVPGSMVTITSLQSRLPAPFYAHYAASKAALLSLTKSFAADLAPRGIRVNSVAPGAIETRLWELADGEMARLRGVEPGTPKRERIAGTPFRRLGQPDEIAAAVAFLASDDASYITGECLHVCGGDFML